MQEHTLISLPEEILQKPDGFGRKTIRLAELVKEQVPVPAFVGVSAESLARVFTDDGEVHVLMDLETEVRAALPNTTLYAVRSSALKEDGDDSAHAGEFHTELAVKDTELGIAITRVIRDAQKKNVPLSDFSILIQIYITPHFAGVLFTRDPLGTQETIVEYHPGTTTDVVLGRKSERITYIRNGVVPHAPFNLHSLAKLSLQIENIYARPQDIEWASDGGTIWIIQTRSITTLSIAHHQALLEAEKFLSTRKHFYFERTGIAASYPTPHRLHYEILAHLASSDGVLSQVYRQYGIKRKDTSSLVLIKHQLYIDKEAELQEFFPSLSFFQLNNGTPATSSLLGLFRTQRNKSALSKLPISSGTSAQLAVSLSHTLSTCEALQPAQTTREAFDTFISVYPLIFSANILSLACYANVERLLPKDAPPLVAFLNYKLHGVGNQGAAIQPPTGELLGNSLDIADESPFRAYRVPPSIEGASVASWCEAQDPVFMTQFESALQDYRNFEHLREVSRWLTVLLVNRIRTALKSRVRAQNIEWSPLFFELSLKELLEETFDIATLTSRDLERTQDIAITLPPLFSSFLLQKKDDVFVVSRGKATGTLMTEAMLNTVQVNPNQKPILLVDTLHPGLVAYFDRISGIISCEGALLAHLSIMAREARIPVMVFPRAKLDLPLQSHIYLDADMARINIIQ